MIGDCTKDYIESDGLVFLVESEDESYGEPKYHLLKDLTYEGLLDLESKKTITEDMEFKNEEEKLEYLEYAKKNLISYDIKKKLKNKAKLSP